MKHPQIVVFENDGLLAKYLAPLMPRSLDPQHPEHTPPRWLLRESRQAPACLNLLREGGPSVLVLKVGRNLVRELAVLDEVHAALPDVPVVVVGDTEDDAIEVLDLDLGAAYVLQPPEPRHHLVDLVEHLLAASIERMQGKPSEQSEPIEDEDA